MSFEIYFVNHTKKQIVSSKRLSGGFEDGDQLLAYLSLCNGDSIDVMGEGSGFIEKNVEDLQGKSEYTYLKLWEYKITGTQSSDTREQGLNEAEHDRLFAAVYPEQFPT